MIHDSLQIPELANLSRKTYGTDKLTSCFSKLHFMKYNKDISYQYNTRGFRDSEWGEDSLISQKIWNELDKGNRFATVFKENPNK